MESPIDRMMTLGEHLDELRGRIILALIGLVIVFVACLFFGDFFLSVLNWPMARACENISAENPEFQTALYTHHPAEKILVHLKTSLTFGIILSSPWLFYQLWSFISVGLHQREKRFVRRVLPLSVFLFICGCAFFLFALAPLIIEFFLSFDIGINAQDQWRLREYISFIATLTVVFGIGFQLPLLIIASNRLGVITVKQLSKYRPYVILSLVFIAAILTPPDVISQIALAGPMYLLYEISVLICKISKNTVY